MPTVPPRTETEFCSDFNILTLTVALPGLTLEEYGLKVGNQELPGHLQLLHHPGCEAPPDREFRRFHI